MTYVFLPLDCSLAQFTFDLLINSVYETTLNQGEDYTLPYEDFDQTVTYQM